MLLITDHGIYILQMKNKTKLGLGVEFYKMLSFVGNIRISFFLFQNGYRPIKCKGRMIGFECRVHNIIEFKHLKFGSKYLEKAALPIQNIRFIPDENFDKFNDYIINNNLLKKLFENHIERRYKSLNKFSYGTEDSMSRCSRPETV